LTYFSTSRGDHVSGRFPMIENGLEFQLVPGNLSSKNASASTSSASNATTAASSVASEKQRCLGLSAQNRNGPPIISRFRCAVCAVRTRSVELGKGRASPEQPYAVFRANPPMPDELNRSQCRVKRIFRRRQYPQAFRCPRKDAVLRDNPQMRALTLRGEYTSFHSGLDLLTQRVRADVNDD
jgi:hypothetical protein